MTEWTSSVGLLAMCCICAVSRRGSGNADARRSWTYRIWGCSLLITV